MAIAPDLLASALPELMESEETFTQFHPLMSELYNRGQRERLGGIYKQFDLVPNGPGRLNPEITGQEILHGGLKQNPAVGRFYVSHTRYIYDVPEKVLRNADEKQGDLANIIEQYPERGLLDFQQRIARQLAVGGEPLAENIFTFNGDQTYDPQGYGARSGAFEFAATASQSNTVFDVPYNSVTGWNHQYGVVTSARANMRRVFSRVFTACNVQGQKAKARLDLGFCDSLTWENILDIYDLQIVNVNTKVKDSETRPEDIREAIQYRGVNIFLESALDDTSRFTTTDAQAGVLYLLASKNWRLLYQPINVPGATDYNNDCDFFPHKPVRHPNQAIWRYETELSIGLGCNDMRGQGVITGGARP